MSRFYAGFGVLAAGACGVFTAYAAFQPELKRQQEIREGTFDAQHEKRNEHALSDAIASDLKEARKEVVQGIKGDDVNKSGFAWKLRHQLFGSARKEEQKKMEEAPTAVQAVVGRKDG